MSMSDIIENLKQSVLFEKVRDPVLEKVADIVEFVTVKDGETLIEKGERGNSMFIVCSGKVKVHDGDLLLNHLEKGSAFGEMAALDGEVRTASITAVEDTKLLQLDRDDLRELFGREPEVAEALIHFLCQRGKSIIGDITDRSYKLRALEREFEIGRDIQSGFLPESLPEIPGWEIAAYFKAAREVAGDFYDVFEIENQNKIGLVIGDVCGKGVGAALFMSLFRSLMRASMISGDFMNWAADTGNPQNLLHDSRQILRNSVSLTNNYVARIHGNAFMFSTVFAAILDPGDSSMIYINAGHESPVIYNKNGVKNVLDTTGPAVGLFADETYTVEQVTFDPGDTIIGFTDGVTEAVNPANELFTSERMLNILIGNKNSLNEALQKVVQSLKDFTHDVEQFDDITLLALNRS